MDTRPAVKPAFTIPSIIAAVAALLSFQFGAFFGLLLAIVAILAGIVGMLFALAPQRRGGIISGVSVVLGLIGIIAAAVKLLGGNL